MLFYNLRIERRAKMDPEEWLGPSEYPRSFTEREPLVKPTGKETIQDTEKGADSEIRTYRWRWVVLILYSLSNAMVNIIWIPSAPIADVVSCYYGVTLFWVNALSQVYMLSYVVLLFLIVWMLDKYGLSVCLAIATCCDAAGAALKLAGTGEALRLSMQHQS